MRPLHETDYLKTKTLSFPHASSGNPAIFSTRSHWARIVPDNPVAFPPSLAVIPAQKHTGMT